MKNIFKKILLVLLAFCLIISIANAASIFKVTAGGTGVGTLTGIVKGNGTSAFSAASDGTDYLSSTTGAVTALSNLSSVAINTTLLPGSNDGAALGTGAKSFSDLFLASGAVVNFNNGDVLLTHSADTLTVSGGGFVSPTITDSGLTTARVPFSTTGGLLTDSAGLTYDGTALIANTASTNVKALRIQAGGGGDVLGIETAAGTQRMSLGFTGSQAIVKSTNFPLVINNNGTGGLLLQSGTSITVNITTTPSVNDGAALGTGALSFSDLFLASGGVINFANGDVVLTHSTGILTLGTGDLQITTAGSNAASVVTVGGTQTLTNKTLTSPTLTAPSLGVATATTLNALTLTAQTTGYTIAGGNTNNRTLTMQGNVTLSTSMTLAGGGAGVTLTMPGSSDTIVGRASTDTLTNKTLTTPKLTGFTVAGLPAGTVGMIAYVTDALAPSFGTTVVGGGAVTIPVFYNGANWVTY